jgi:uncharacterized protein (DUF362 family)
MESRRDFLKTAAVGAVLLGTETTLALAKPADAAKSRVVVATDEGLRGQSGVPDEQRVAALLDRAMKSYWHHARPADAWKNVVKPGQVVGLKVNTIAGKGLSSHVALVAAICERLQQAGIKPGNIIIWDRTNRELESAGFAISTDPNKIQCFGTDSVGYEDEVVSYGSVKTQLSKILTRKCDMVIGVPVLKDHEIAGITLAMKNMYGVIKNPYQLHSGGCNPHIADLNMLEPIRTKVRFTIGDAFTGIYQGGPGFKPQYVWNHNALIVGEDRVAVDATAWKIIERKRAEKGLPTLEAAGRPPHYLATAADATHRLGLAEGFALIEV